jgi:hypothetical protein
MNIVQGNVEILEIDSTNRRVKAIVYVADPNILVKNIQTDCYRQVQHVVLHYLIPEGFLSCGDTPWQFSVYPYKLE